MIPLPSGTRIWLVAGVTDMRKSFNGLGELVQHVLDDNPFSGHLFIFRGRKGDTVRILWADADGLCLFTKRLEEGQFVWPAVRDGNWTFNLNSDFQSSQFADNANTVKESADGSTGRIPGFMLWGARVAYDFGPQMADLNRRSV